jgi:predicted dienelactone hydrolase
MRAHSNPALRVLPLVMATACLALALPAASAAEAGFRQMTVPNPTADGKPAHFALYYPTAETARTIPMGPFPQTVAINGAPAPAVKGLIVISHGTLSTQMGFATLAQTLARHGYLVASVEHVGDTWQDPSMRATPARYFAERPRQVSRVIDTVLADPQWSSRMAQGADGRPLIGAIGHSAGGYTVLALAGGKPVLSRLRAHCETEAALDPVLLQAVARHWQRIGAGRRRGGRSGRAGAGRPPRARRDGPGADGRGVQPSSLASITVPVAIYAGEKDTFLVPRFHAHGSCRT